MLSTMVGVGNATGAAMRRRQRRLRAWARHERLSIAMALSTVEHHSYVAVACSRLVLLATIHLALFSLPWFAGP